MRKSLVLLGFMLLTALPLSAQILADSFIGYWTSSSGTSIAIGHGNSNQQVLLWIGNGAAQEGWLSSNRDGDPILTYNASDGTVMNATYVRGSDMIHLTSTTSSFTANWRRN